MPKAKTPDHLRDAYFDERARGAKEKEAADRVGVGIRTAQRWETERRNAQEATRRPGQDFHKAKSQVAGILEPPAYDELVPAAKAAYQSIGFFARRYYGVILMPFQILATKRTVELLATDEEEYLVVNQAPGTGKSWFYTRILPAWMTVRDRTLRGLIGSASDNLAKSYTDILRSDFTRQEPLEHPVMAKRQGIAVDAAACLVYEFGRFKPDPGEGIWTQSAFRVVQLAGQGALSKEATWRATSLEARFIGNRANVSVWDDAYDPGSYRTAESREQLFRTWDDVAEPRVEPGGVLILPMQRLGPDDLSNHCLQKVSVLDEDEALEEHGLTDALANLELPRKYHHIKFKAHYEDKCRGRETHGKDAEPWRPDGTGGCLLYPKRLTYRKLATLKANNSSNFECTPAETPILMADWTDRSIADVKPGDWVMGFESRQAPGKGGLRDYRVATQVEAVIAVGIREVVEITLEDGRRLRSTADHPWWYRTGRGKEYAPAEVGARLSVFDRPVYVDPSEMADWAYVAGIVDGEGHIPQKTACAVTIAQSKTANPEVFASIQAALDRLGVDYHIYEPEHGRGAHLFQIRDTRAFLRRLLTAAPWLGKANQIRHWLSKGTNSMTGSRCRVVSIESVGEEVVYGLTTGTANYFAWGVPCHNTVYQQEDVDPQSVLVDPVWVSGGTDRNGDTWPGCWDNDRDVCDVPALAKPVFSIATVDPSPTKFWAIQWWLYHPDTEQRFLMDLLRLKMSASHLLDKDDAGEYTGVMEDWQRRSETLGHRITHWVVETNAAARFLLQYRHAQVWQMREGVQIIKHDTNRNKADKDLGVQTVGNHWKYGRVRLPGKQQTMARPTSLKLLDEVTRWPGGATDDQVMAYWFLEWNLPRISASEDDDRPMWRPSWLNQGVPA